MAKRWRKPKANAQKSKRRRGKRRTSDSTYRARGTMQGMRAGLKRLAGGEKGRQKGWSPWVNIALWGAAIYLGYRVVIRFLGTDW